MMRPGASHSRTFALSHFRTAVLGVPLRCAPCRAARALGHDTTVPKCAEPPPQPARYCCAVCSGVSALRARIPHATATATTPDRRLPAGPSPPGPLSRTRPVGTLECLRCTGEGEQSRNAASGPGSAGGRSPRADVRPPSLTRRPANMPGAHGSVNAPVPAYFRTSVLSYFRTRSPGPRRSCRTASARSRTPRRTRGTRT